MKLPVKHILAACSEYQNMKLMTSLVEVITTWPAGSKN